MKGISGGKKGKEKEKRRNEKRWEKGGNTNNFIF